LNYAREQQIFL